MHTPFIESLICQEETPCAYLEKNRIATDWVAVKECMKFSK